MESKSYKLLDVIKFLYNVSPLKYLSWLIYILFNALIPAYQTIAMGMFIDTALEIFNHKVLMNTIILPALLMSASFIFVNLMPPIMSLIEVKFRQKLEKNLKSNLITKQMNLEYKHIENKETLDLMDRTYSNVVDQYMSIFKLVLNTMGITINIVSLLMIIMKYSYWVGIVTLIISIPLFYKSMSLGQEIYTMTIDVNKIKRKYEYLDKILTSREFSEERKLFQFTTKTIDSYKTLYEESYNIEKNALIRTFYNLKKGSIVTLFLALIIISLLLTSVYQRTISIGIFIGLTNATFNLVQTMSWDLSSIVVDYAKSKEFLIDFSKFISLSEKLDASAIPNRKSQFKFDSLEFKNVSFTYPGTDTPILNNCSFKLFHDKTYGFVGANGAGKTTIVKLVTGLYDDYTGNILINGIDLKAHSLAELKSMIAVLFQDFARYSTTIKENIMNGNFNKDDPILLNEVVIKTGVNNIYKDLPQELNTTLGKLKETSTDLSGGQWQRIAIARLFYADAPINILDEPTASLDPFEESRIYELFKKANQNNFSLYITHRLGIVKNLDCILVLDKGNVCEMGSHEELMNNESIYYEMYSSQQKWYKKGVNTDEAIYI